ncbi:MAG: replication-associated recombination protein A [Acholeplasmatales bacterium]|nr:replication-associated recombination protein A [Acholeplasmatales bacterium]
MMPLAYKLRPSTFDDIIGQDHLVGPKGVIRKMLNTNKLCSMILYGPAGCGKTSIAEIIVKSFPLNSYSFNASTDSKAKLKEIADGAKYYESSICIIDEIHRMKKDIQDFLLPYVESGTLTIIGLTTENPYRSINPAIRSRCHIYRMNEISKEDVKTLLVKTIEKENLKKLSDDILEYISVASSSEIRTALNMLEVVEMLDEDELNLENAQKLIGKKAFQIDEKGEYYYDCASAMIKSIRGSDPDAALHYMARLLETEDLEFITRRLICSAYEDVGLGNPNIGPRTIAACDAALRLGLPEARIPLGYIVVDLATSPKSNSTYLGIDKAIADLENMTSMSIPPHILNKELKSGKFEYKYPHDYKHGYVKQQYLPDELIDTIYYEPKTTGSYERGIIDFMKKLKEEK